MAVGGVDVAGTEGVEPLHDPRDALRGSPEAERLGSRLLEPLELGPEVGGEEGELLDAGDRHVVLGDRVLEALPERLADGAVVGQAHARVAPVLLGVADQEVEGHLVGLDELEDRALGDVGVEEPLGPHVVEDRDDRDAVTGDLGAGLLEPDGRAPQDADDVGVGDELGVGPVRGVDQLLGLGVHDLEGDLRALDEALALDVLHGGPERAVDDVADELAEALEGGDDADLQAGRQGGAAVASAAPAGPRRAPGAPRARAPAGVPAVAVAAAAPGESAPGPDQGHPGQAAAGGPLHEHPPVDGAADQVVGADADGLVLGHGRLLCGAPGGRGSAGSRASVTYATIGCKRASPTRRRLLSGSCSRC
ncbi:MAG: hypothetical protein M5U14_16925 [Acidimicrobiia bacterium]|nr:hypothetical protein [Acidimicrobiia bacterium]